LNLQESEQIIYEISTDGGVTFIPILEISGSTGIRTDELNLSEYIGQPNVQLGITVNLIFADSKVSVKDILGLGIFKTDKYSVIVVENDYDEGNSGNGYLGPYPYKQPNCIPLLKSYDIQIKLTNLAGSDININDIILNFADEYTTSYNIKYQYSQSTNSNLLDFIPSIPLYVPLSNSIIFQVSIFISDIGNNEIGSISPINITFQTDDENITVLSSTYKIGDCCYDSINNFNKDFEYIINLPSKTESNSYIILNHANVNNSNNTVIRANDFILLEPAMYLAESYPYYFDTITSTFINTISLATKILIAPSNEGSLTAEVGICSSEDGILKKPIQQSTSVYNSIVDLYPIPCNDYLFLELSKNYDLKNLSVIDLIGNKINIEFSIISTTEDSLKIKLNTSNLNNGLYIINIYHNNTISKKFIKIM